MPSINVTITLDPGRMRDLPKDKQRECEIWAHKTGLAMTEQLEIELNNFIKYGKDGIFDPSEYDQSQPVNYQGD